VAQEKEGKKQSFGEEVRKKKERAGFKASFTQN